MGRREVGAGTNSAGMPVGKLVHQVVRTAANGLVLPGIGYAEQSSFRACRIYGAVAASKGKKWRGKTSFQEEPFTERHFGGDGIGICPRPRAVHQAKTDSYARQWCRDPKRSQSKSTAKPRTAIEIVNQKLPGTGRITLGADKAYDTAEFVATCLAFNVTPHVAANDRRRGGSTLDGRTLCQPAYLISQQKRKRVEEIFGWIKTVANFRRTRYRGREFTQLADYPIGAAYNLMRISRLIPVAA